MTVAKKGKNLKSLSGPTEKISPRQAKISRDTAETKISVSLNIDGAGKTDVRTGIGFFDHMLTLLASHARFDLSLKAAGDLDVDAHHTVEDAGIALGLAIKEAAGDKAGIARYGSFFLPMDETLALVALDFSGRPLLVYGADNAVPMSPRLGGYDTELTEEFLRALAVNAGLTLHVKILYGTNTHHKIEAVFKGLGHALRAALSPDERVAGVLSTKGVL